jgi:hypothetical protein
MRERVPSAGTALLRRARRIAREERPDSARVTEDRGGVNGVRRDLGMSSEHLVRLIQVAVPDRGFDEFVVRFVDLAHSRNQYY